MLAPPNESTLPSVAVPTIVYSFAAPAPMIRTWSPTSKPASSAEDLSITTWSSVSGVAPS